MPLKKVGGAWSKSGPDGEPYLSCSIELVKGKRMYFHMYRNKKKHRPDFPDYIIYYVKMVRKGARDKKVEDVAQGKADYENVNAPEYCAGSASEKEKETGR